MLTLGFGLCAANCLLCALTVDTVVFILFIMLATFCINIYFGGVAIYTLEVYETEIRNMSVAYFNVSSRILSGFAPFLVMELFYF